MLNVVAFPEMAKQRAEMNKRRGVSTWSLTVGFTSCHFLWTPHFCHLVIIPDINYGRWYLFS